MRFLRLSKNWRSIFLGRRSTAETLYLFPTLSSQWLGNPSTVSSMAPAGEAWKYRFVPHQNETKLRAFHHVWVLRRNREKLAVFSGGVIHPAAGARAPQALGRVRLYHRWPEVGTVTLLIYSVMSCFNHYSVFQGEKPSLALRITVLELLFQLLFHISWTKQWCSVRSWMGCTEQFMMSQWAVLNNLWWHIHVSRIDQTMETW